MNSLKIITKGLKKDDMTEYLEHLQFNPSPAWIAWLDSNEVYKFKYSTNDDARDFEDFIEIKAIPLTIVEYLSEIDSLHYMNRNPAISEKAKNINNAKISNTKNKIWELSYKYSQEGYGKQDIYVYWVWCNGYFDGIYKGKILRTIKDYS